MMEGLLEPPRRNRAQVHRQPEERQQHVGREVFGLTLQRRDLHRGERAIRPMQRMQLVRDDHFDLPVRRGRVESRGTFRRRPEFWPAVHDRDAGNVLQRQGPVDSGVAAARDHDPFAAEGLLLFDVILHRAGRFVGRQPVQRRTVGPERAGPGGDDHRFCPNCVALIRR